MSIDNETVKKLLGLLGLGLSNDEDKLKNELNNILKWVDELKKVDTKNVEPMLSVFNESMVMRKDKSETNFSNEKILKNSP